MKKKISWRHDSGDHEETYDWYLWIGKKPTSHIISQWSGIYSYYKNGVEIGMADTLKEAKQLLLEELGYEEDK